MRLSKISKIVSLLQSLTGGAAIVFAFFLFYDVFGLQEILGVSEAYIGLYLLLLTIFGLLSIISGLILMSNKQS